MMAPAAAAPTVGVCRSMASVTRHAPGGGGGVKIDARIKTFRSSSSSSVLALNNSIAGRRRRASVRARASFASRAVVSAAGVSPEEASPSSSAASQEQQRRPVTTREVEVVFRLPSWGGEGTAVIVGEHDSLGSWDPEAAGTSRTRARARVARARRH